MVNSNIVLLNIHADLFVATHLTITIYLTLTLLLHTQGQAQATLIFKKTQTYTFFAKLRLTWIFFLISG